MRTSNRHRQANGAHPARRKSASVDKRGSQRPLTLAYRKRRAARTRTRPEMELTAFLKEHPVDISKIKVAGPRLPAKRRMRG